MLDYKLSHNNSMQWLVKQQIISSKNIETNIQKRGWKCHAFGMNKTQLYQAVEDKMQMDPEITIMGSYLQNDKTNLFCLKENVKEMSKMGWGIAGITHAPKTLNFSI